jgi:hypothetical protein
MQHQPVFAGLVVDEYDRSVETACIGEEAAYVVDDAGFRRHIPAEEVDRQVVDFMKQQIHGNEDMITEQTAKMLGQEDVFSKAMIENQLRHLDESFDALLANGLPEETRAYMGMMGFRVVINLHGEVLRVDQPTKIADEGDE